MEGLDIGCKGCNLFMVCIIKAGANIQEPTTMMIGENGYRIETGVVMVWFNKTEAVMVGRIQKNKWNGVENMAVLFGSRWSKRWKQG